MIALVVDEIIEYIQGKINADSDLPDINVCDAYKYAHRVNKTEIQVSIVDHSEFARFTTFEDGKVYISPLQFNIFATQMTIGNETLTAQKASYYLAQKVIDWLNTIELRDAIPEVIGARNSKYTSGRPFDTGTVLYQAVVRTDLYLERN